MVKRRTRKRDQHRRRSRKARRHERKHGEKIPTFGSRAQVWHRTAKKTRGGLTRSDLTMNKHGHIVSKRRQAIAKREKRLVKAGYIPKKGKFVLMRKR